MKKKEQEIQERILNVSNNKDSKLKKLKQFRSIESKIASAQGRNNNNLNQNFKKKMQRSEDAKAPSSLPPIERAQK